MASPWEQFKASKAKPWDFFNPNTEYAEKEVSEERLSACKMCPELIKATHQCKQCGCFMAAKVKLEHATCPLNKWRR